jgi:hypothetical protein
MNERIKELALQARNYALDEKRIYERMHNTEQCMEEYREVYNEKFAELIVRECMAQIEEVKQIKAGHAGLEYTQGFDDGMFVAIRTIEEHFGVEE